MSTADELRDLAIRATEDPGELDDLTDEQIQGLRKRLNPAGGVVSGGSEKYINMSVIDWSDIMRRKQLVMALIGFVSRTITEYEPEEEAMAIRESYNEKLAAAKNAKEVARINAEIDAEIKIIRDAHRSVARKVFNRHFEYDPDVHVSKAKAGGHTDAEQAELRKKIQTQLSADAQKTANEVLAKETTFATLKKLVLAAHQNLTESVGELKGAVKSIYDPALDAADKATLVTKRMMRVQKLQSNLAKIAEPIQAADCADMVKYQPPSDVFHQFERYISNHWEFIQMLTLAYYNEKPDLEFMITVYSTHDTPQDAADYCKQHARDFRQTVVTVPSGAPCFLGPYKANRERIGFYTQDTEVLRRMAEQADTDAKLGKDMLEKKTRRLKKTNIRTVGPDSAGLKQYRGFETEDGSENAAMHGAKRVISPDEMKELEADAAEEHNVDLEEMSKMASAITGKDYKEHVSELASTIVTKQEAAAAKKKADEAAKFEKDQERLNRSKAKGAPSKQAVAKKPAAKKGTSAAKKGADAKTTATASKNEILRAGKPVGDALTGLQKNSEMTQKGVYNAESAYVEKPTDDKFELSRRTGNYVVNDTDDDALRDDEVVTEIFAPVENEDGEIELRQSLVATRAEAPKHLEKGSAFHEKYQK